MPTSSPAHAPVAGNAPASEDLGPLAWVSAEIQKSTELAVKSLRRVARETGLPLEESGGLLRMARQQLHQATGVLRMVGHGAPARLLGVMEQAVGRFVDEPPRCTDDSVSRIEHAGFALTDFIGAVLAGKRVSTVALFPQYRDVLELVRGERVHPADLWNYPWVWAEVQRPTSHRPLAYGPAVRAVFDRAILKVVKEGDESAARELSALCVALGLGAAQPKVASFWMLASGFFEALALGLVPADSYVKLSASRVLLQYTVLARGELNVSERLGQDLLFFCAQAAPGSRENAPMLRAVRVAWGVQNHGAVNYGAVQFGRFDPAVLAQARKRIETAKEMWTALAGGDTQRIRQVSDSFGQLGDSLHKLHPVTAPMVQALQDAVEASLRSGQPPSTELAMEVATSVLYLEAAFEDLDPQDQQLTARTAQLAARIESARRGGQSQPLEPWMEELYRRVSDRQTMGSIVDELRAHLLELEKSLDQFFRRPNEKASLRVVPGQLQQMRGVFSVLGLEQAAQTVQHMRDEVESLMAQRGAVEPADHDLLGNNLGALGFLIDMLGYQPGLARRLFVFDEARGELKPLMGRQLEDTPVHGIGADAGVAGGISVPQTDSVLSVEDVDKQIAAKLAALATPAKAPRAAAPAPARGAGSSSARIGDAAALADTEVTELEEDDLQAIFLEEAGEVLQQGRAAVIALERDPTDTAELTVLRRAFHTLKGSSRMVGLMDYGDAAWAYEQVLNTWLADQRPVTSELLSGATQALDQFSQWADAIARREAHGWEPAPLRAAAEALGRGEAAPPVQTARHLDDAAALAVAARQIAADLPPAEEPAPASPLPDEPAASPVSVRALPDLPDLPDLDLDLPADAAPTERPGLAELAALAERAERGDEERRADAEALDLHGDDFAITDIVHPLYEESPQRPPATEALELGEIDFEDALRREAPGTGTGESTSKPAPAEEPLAFTLPSDWTEEGQPRPTRVDEVSQATPAGLPDLDLPGELPPLEPGGEAAKPSEAIAALDSTRIELTAPALPEDEEMAQPQAATEPVFLADSAVLQGLDLDLDPAPVSSAQESTPASTGAQDSALEQTPASDEAGDLPESADVPDASGVDDEVLAESDSPNDSRPVLTLVPPAPLDAPQPAAGFSEDAVKVIGPLRIGIALYNVYLNEADEWSRQLANDVGEWALQPHETVSDSTVALAHSLAGSSATVGFQGLSGMARLFEAVLQHLRGHGDGTAAKGAALVAAAHEVRRLLHQFAAGFLKEPDPVVLQSLRQLLIAPLPPAQPPQADGFEPQESAATFAPTARSTSGLGLEDEDAIDIEDVVDPELFPIFEEEAAELLPQLDRALQQWAHSPTDSGPRTAALRTLHTLKGSARLAGAMRLGERAHRMESAIEAIAVDAGERDAIEALAAAFDGLQLTFDALRSADEAGQAELAQRASEAVATAPAQPATAFLEELPEPARAEQEAEADRPEQAQAWGEESPQTAQPRQPGDGAGLAAPLLPPATLRLGAVRAASTQTVRVRTQLLDRLVSQSGEVIITRSRLEAGLQQLSASLSELTGNLDRLRQQLRDVEVQAESQMQSRLAQTLDTPQSFDPLEFDRFTRVQELTRMMAESVNDVATVQRTLQKTVQTAEDGLAAQGRQTRDLQRGLLRTRMVEFESLADRLYRVVRQASKDTGKQVRLDITGGSIEMDRGVLERMTPAFEHLLRNCVAHGIEDAETRERAGKDAVGLVRIALSQEGNDVSVRFADDGAGLQRDRILARARALGLSEASELSAAEAAELIFLPGFTTVSQVSELAGRGIGMDVVRAEVAALGGRIETHSADGQGTEFRLVLPLTTAVTHVVMLRAGENTVGVPSNLVELVQRANAEELARAYETQHYPFGGEDVPFYWSGALLQSSARSERTAGRTNTIVVVRSAAQRLALHVDEVLGNQEVVVKNLGPQLARVPGMAGISVLASGAVALIYNPVALAALHGESARALQSLHKSASSSAAAAAVAPQAQEESPSAATPVPAPLQAAAQIPLVLVVDDSITVRRVTQRLLQREGYRVALAADGLQALERLQQERPSVVLSDIEMPRMDGFDLARNIRADAALAGLPIIMITSRIAEKHREHARELGVDHYLGKPYSEDDLLALVRRFTQQQASSDPVSV
ncbi:Hpt domain-containing protein [Xenophilus arseniciresistens]|uniref:Chemotaxis protein CheA n=1 Tax=Xenophilus arseniciresistens TaxID=1283306 RepID=A0AAE3SZ22_9BURK|nr:Hpt domain-containing protein [Xenophilus arseniciresistens]MDA7415386.1 Hpt domain-containing protein [Xenophilus arseniciresistens]